MHPQGTAARIHGRLCPFPYPCAGAGLSPTAQDPSACAGRGSRHCGAVGAVAASHAANAPAAWVFGTPLGLFEENSASVSRPHRMQRVFGAQEHGQTRHAQSFIIPMHAYVIHLERVNRVSMDIACTSHPRVQLRIRHNPSTTWSGWGHTSAVVRALLPVGHITVRLMVIPAPFPLPIPPLVPIPVSPLVPDIPWPLEAVAVYSVYPVTTPVDIAVIAAAWAVLVPLVPRSIASAVPLPLNESLPTCSVRVIHAQLVSAKFP